MRGILSLFKKLKRGEKDISPRDAFWAWLDDNQIPYQSSYADICDTHPKRRDQWSNDHVEMPLHNVPNIIENMAAPLSVTYHRTSITKAPIETFTGHIRQFEGDRNYIYARTAFTEIFDKLGVTGKDNSASNTQSTIWRFPHDVDGHTLYHFGDSRESSVTITYWPPDKNQDIQNTRYKENPDKIKECLITIKSGWHPKLSAAHMQSYEISDTYEKIGDLNPPAHCGNIWQQIAQIQQEVYALSPASFGKIGQDFWIIADDLHAGFVPFADLIKIQHEQFTERGFPSETISIHFKQPNMTGATSIRKIILKYQGGTQERQFTTLAKNWAAQFGINYEFDQYQL